MYSLNPARGQIIPMGPLACSLGFPTTLIHAFSCLGHRVCFAHAHSLPFRRLSRLFFLSVFVTLHSGSCPLLPAAFALRFGLPPSRAWTNLFIELQLFLPTFLVNTRDHGSSSFAPV